MGAGGRERRETEQSASPRGGLGARAHERQQLSSREAILSGMPKPRAAGKPARDSNVTWAAK